MELRIIYFDYTPTKVVEVKSLVEVIGDMVLLDSSEVACARSDGGPLIETATGKPCMVSVRP